MEVSCQCIENCTIKCVALRGGSMKYHVRLYSALYEIYILLDIELLYRAALLYSQVPLYHHIVRVYT